VVGAATPSPDTLRIALFGSVGPERAPASATDAERLVFRQLYETLVRVDCAGELRPGLAVQWRADDRQGTRWIFHLAPDARFWDGTPVDAAALREGWLGGPGLPVTDVQPSADGSVVVSLSEGRSLPDFADPAWSVVKRIAESSWPLGTGPVWIAGWEPADAPRVLRARPVPHAPDGTPVVEFRAAAHRDPRDMLDGDVDVMITREAGVMRYAAGRGDWRVVPLPWDRVYVLASPVRIRSGTSSRLDADAQAALARDAVRDEARAPERADAGWWAIRCANDVPEPAAGAARPAAGSSAVVAPAGDRVAGDLVARLVARADHELTDLLGARPAGTRAAAPEAAEFATQFAAGQAAAFVLPLPARPLDRCRAAADLRTRAPWLAASGSVVADALVPLVETRAYLLLRQAPAVTLGHDAEVRVVPGWSR